MATLFEIIKQNKEGSKSSIPVYKDGGKSINWDKMKTNQRREYIVRYLKGKGIKDVQVAAIVGNLEQENGTFDTKLTNSIGATGIAQWYKTRADELRKKNNPTDINTQLNYLLEELNGTKHWSTRAGGKNAFFKTNDLKEATRIFRKDFERPGEAEAHDNKRYKYALNVLGKSSEYTPYEQEYSSTSEYGQDSPYSKLDFSNAKVDYSNMNARMESDKAYQKAMLEAIQSESNSKIALNQAQIYALEKEQQEKLATQEAEKKKEEQEQIQSILEERNKQRETLMEVGMQAIPEYIENETNALSQLASSPMNFQFQGGFQQLVQGQRGGMFQESEEFETINLPEVVVKAETPITMLGKEFEKNNNYSNFVYGKPQTTFDSYTSRQDKYEKLKNEYIANEISRQYSGKRGRILNEIKDEYGDDMHDFVIANSTDRNVRENVYDNFKSGVLNLNGSFNPYRSNREQANRGNVITSRLQDIGDITSPLSVPYNVVLGKNVANSKGETDYTYGDALSGVVPRERDEIAEIAGDPLNLIGIGIADEALRGFKGIKDVLKITPKLNSEGVEAKNMLKTFYSGKTYLQDIDKYKLNTLLNDESGRDALFKHIINRDNTFFRGVDPEHPEAIRVAREAGIDVNDKDAIIKHIAGTIPNKPVGERVLTKKVDGLDELHTSNEPSITRMYNGKYDKTAVVRKPTNFKGSRLDWLINNSNIYKLGSGRDLRGATAFSDDVVPRDENVFRFQGKPNEKILDVIDVQPVDKLLSDIKKGIRYDISAQGSPIGNNLSSGASNKLYEMYNRIITRKNTNPKITDEEIDIFNNDFSKDKNIFKGGGMFNKMYDEYNKININSFKAKFIK